VAERLNADVDLLDRIVRRDASAIAELYDRHSRVVYGVILRIVRDIGRGRGRAAGGVPQGLGTGGDV
jgi:hypothetical protein